MNFNFDSNIMPYIQRTADQDIETASEWMKNRIIMAKKTVELFEDLETAGAV
jgi:hypothetical protein